MCIRDRTKAPRKPMGTAPAARTTTGPVSYTHLDVYKRQLKLKVINLKTDPQLMGALGAAEYARQKGIAKGA